MFEALNIGQVMLLYQCD